MKKVKRAFDTIFKINISRLNFKKFFSAFFLVLTVYETLINSTTIQAIILIKQTHFLCSGECERCSSIDSNDI